MVGLKSEPKKHTLAHHAQDLQWTQSGVRQAAPSLAEGGGGHAALAEGGDHEALSLA